MRTLRKGKLDYLLIGAVLFSGLIGSDISARIVEIPITIGNGENHNLQFNQITNVNQSWYRVTILKMTLNEYPGHNITCPARFVGQWNDFNYQDDLWLYPKNGGDLFFDFGTGNNDHDAVWLIFDDDPRINLVLGDCTNNNTGEHFSAPGTLTLLLESDFPDSSFGDSDWNGDGEINVIDVILLVEWIIAGE